MSVDTTIVKDFTITDPDGDSITASLTEGGSSELPPGVTFGHQSGDIWRFEWPRWDETGIENWSPGRYNFKVSASDGKDTSNSEFLVYITETGTYGQYLHFLIDLAIDGTGATQDPWPGAVAELTVTENGATLDQTNFAVSDFSDEEDDALYRATNAIDGDTATYWHTQFTPDDTPYPHWIIIDLQQVRLIEDVKYTPRQDEVSGRAKTGRVMVRDAAIFDNAAVHVNSYDVETDELVKTFTTVAPLPSMTSLADQTIQEGGTLSLSGTAAHPQQTPSFSLLRIDSGSIPAGVSLTDNGDGTWDLAWTPDVGEAGDYAFAVVADSGGYVKTRQFDVTVTSAEVPVFGTFPSDISFGSGTEIDVNVSAEHSNGPPTITIKNIQYLTDEDGNILTDESGNQLYDELAMPSGIAFSSFATSGNEVFYKFTWTPTAVQAGSYTFLFTADRDGASASEDWSVAISVHQIAPSSRQVVFEGGSRTITLS